MIIVKKILHVLKKIIIGILCFLGLCAAIGAFAYNVNAEETTTAVKCYSVPDKAITYFESYINNSDSDYVLYSVSDTQSVFVTSKSFKFSDNIYKSDSADIIIFDTSNNTIQKSSVKDFSVNLGNSPVFTSLDKTNLRGAHNYEISIIFGVACILIFLITRDILKYFRNRSTCIS